MTKRATTYLENPSSSNSKEVNKHCPFLMMNPYRTDSHCIRSKCMFFINRKFHEIPNDPNSIIFIEQDCIVHPILDSFESIDSSIAHID